MGIGSKILKWELSSVLYPETASSGLLERFSGVSGGDRDVLLCHMCWYYKV